MMTKSSVTIFLCFVFFANYHVYANQPNFVIFIVDDVSWNDFGCYGNKFVQTPNIDSLAANGLLFKKAYLTTSSCSPSRNSIITGRYPHNTGAAELHTEPPTHLLSLPEVLKKHDYYTLLAGKFHLGKYAERGFDVLHTEKLENDTGKEKMWVQSVKDRPKDKPFFMWLASLDAHRPWGKNEFSGTHNPAEIVPPFYLANTEKTKNDLAKYYDEIKRFDYYVGEVVKELKTQKVLDNTMIIIMTDNGRPFPHSKTKLNDRGIKTPFIVHWPDKIEPQTSNSLVSVIDIAPTIMTLANINNIPKQFQGHSFDKLLENPEKPFRNYIFAEHNWHDYESHERMICTSEYMYILNSRPRKKQVGAFDVINSPSFRDLVLLKDSGDISTEQADVFLTPRPREELYLCAETDSPLTNIAKANEHQEMLAHLRKTLRKWMKETGDDIPENLTKDWYYRKSGRKKTKHHGIRGEMPGSKNKATYNNNKGIF